MQSLARLSTSSGLRHISAAAHSASNHHPHRVVIVRLISTSSSRLKRVLPQQKYDVKDFNLEHEPTYKFETEHEKKYRREFKTVKPKGESRMERQIKELKWDERNTCDTDLARGIRDKRLQSLSDSLHSKGFSREVKPYQPPDDVTERIQTIFAAVLGSYNPSTWLETRLDDKTVKFQVLNRCWRDFGHEVTNCNLHRVVSMRDVLEYYMTPVRGVNSYEALIRESDKLPENLHVIPNPLRFNKETDLMFGGVSAYPKSGLPVRGLRDKKRYESIPADFQWPDI